MILSKFQKIIKYNNSKFRALSCCIIFLSLPACATSSNNESAGEAASTIASQPFRDLNLIRSEIPPALAQITDPYATSPVIECAWINYQLNELNQVLPPDEIRAASVDERTNSEKSSDAVNEATNSAVSTAASSVMPARGIVRRLSGASRNEKAYNDAVERGKIRRGYLRGLARASRCRQIQ